MGGTGSAPRTATLFACHNGGATFPFYLTILNSAHLFLNAPRDGVSRLSVLTDEVLDGCAMTEGVRLSLAAAAADAAVRAAHARGRERSEQVRLQAALWRSAMEERRSTAVTLITGADLVLDETTLVGG